MFSNGYYSFTFLKIDWNENSNTNQKSPGSKK